MNSEENQKNFTSALNKEKININSFLLLSVIGKGSYAKIILVRKKNNHQLYALKILKKLSVDLKNQKEHVKTERNIMVSNSLIL